MSVLHSCIDSKECIWLLLSPFSYLTCRYFYYNVDSMGKVIYEVKLSQDGRHSVSVKSDDPLSLKDALPLAKKIQEHLLGVTAAPGKQPSVQAQDPQAPEAQLC